MTAAGPLALPPALGSVEDSQITFDDTLHRARPQTTTPRTDEQRPRLDISHLAIHQHVGASKQVVA